MFRECDYIKTHDDIILIVRGYHHPSGKVRAALVYFPDANGDRIERTTNRKYIRKSEDYYRTVISRSHPEYISSDPILKHEPNVFVPLEDIAVHYKPQDKMQETMRNGILKDTIWESLILSIHNVGRVPLEDIGIFGSLLLNLNNISSDVDLVVYGIDNVKKLKNNFDEILKNPKFGRLQDEDLFKAATWHSQFYQIGVDRIFRMMKRQWSRIRCENTRQFIKFAYKQNEIPENIITTPPLREIKAKGKVVDAFETHFTPRIAKVKIDDKIVDVATYFWQWSSCVSNADDVEIFGNIRKDGERVYITLDSPFHYLSPLN